MPRIPRDRRVDLVGPDRQPKLFHAGDEWLGSDHPHVLVDDMSIRLMGNLKRGVTIDPHFGNTIHGPVSLVESPENIRIASYWALNPLLMCSVGSSAAMPVPVLVPTKPPLLQAKKDIGSVLSGGLGGIF